MEYANFIAHCLEIARRGEYYVAPNPMVGAVLVRNSDEQILAEGWHQKYGEGHAEVNCFKHFEEQITNHKLQITNKEPRTPWYVALLLELLYPFYILLSLLGGLFRQKKW